MQKVSAVVSHALALVRQQQSGGKPCCTRTWAKAEPDCVGSKQGEYFADLNLAVLELQTAVKREISSHGALRSKASLQELPPYTQTVEVQTPQQSMPLLKEGIMLKRGGGEYLHQTLFCSVVVMQFAALGKTWQKRHFVLRGYVLYRFKVDSLKCKGAYLGRFSSGN